MPGRKITFTTAAKFLQKHQFFQAKDFIPKIMIDAFHEESEQKIKSEDGFPVPDHPGDNLDPMDFLEGDANDVDEQNNDNEIAENNDANHTTSSSDNNLVQIKSEIISDKNNKKKKSEKRKKESYSAETKVSICLSVCLLL